MPDPSLLTKTSVAFAIAWIFLAIPVQAAEATSDESVRNYLHAECPAAIHSVTVTANEVLVRGEIDAKKLLRTPALAEVHPHESIDQLSSITRIHPLEVDSDGRFSFRTRRYTSDGIDRIYAKWAVVADEDSSRILLSAARHATDVTAAARWPNLEPLKPSSPKGLAGITLHGDYQDLIDLGVKNITVNINLRSLVQLEPAGALHHEYAERTWFFRQSTVARLDEVLRFARDHGIIVSAILLVPRLDRSTSLGELLTHPDACDGHYSMANVATQEGVYCYTAAIRFLAERYSQPDLHYGRITHWVIHNEVDAGWVWTNMGTTTALAYMDAYVRSMRIAYYAARSYNPHAKVFISLTHCWNESHLPEDPRYFRGKELLEILREFCKVEGDFEWGIAHHPYPENLFEPRTWLDKKAIPHPDTPYVTFKNLEVLDAWARDPKNSYHGRPRTVLLSEQGFHARGQDPAAQELQAAALAYAWKKIEFLPSIEAFHYHRWVDHEHEGGLLLGLWTVRPGSINTPAERKQAWHVFRALGTPQEAGVIEFAKAVIGLSDWNALRPQLPPPAGLAPAGE